MTHPRGLSTEAQRAYWQRVLTACDEAIREDWGDRARMATVYREQAIADAELKRLDGES